MEYIVLLMVIYIGWKESYKVPKTVRGKEPTDIVDFILRG